MQVTVWVRANSGRIDLLKRCVAALAFQRFARSDYEIAIWTPMPAAQSGYFPSGLMDDDESGFRAWIAKHFGELNVTFVDGLTNRSLASLSRGKVLAFTQDDSIPSLDWLQAGTESLRKHADADLIQGETLLRTSELSATPAAVGPDADGDPALNSFCRKSFVGRFAPGHFLSLLEGPREGVGAAPLGPQHYDAQIRVVRTPLSPASGKLTARPRFNGLLLKPLSRQVH